MSEEVKKNLRTQGKYSDKPFQKNRDKRLKESPGEREPPEKKSQKRNSNGCKSNTSYNGSESELDIKYQHNSSHSFNELEEDKKPTQISDGGEYTLSETANGLSKILYEPGFLGQEEAADLFDTLLLETQWNKKDIMIRGEYYPQPRLVAWYGPFPYSYSGVTLEAAEMPDIILKLKSDIEDYLLKNKINATLNSVLLNYYRDGHDSVAWHSDDEMSMGVCPTIASISLGEIRRFDMKRKVKSYNFEIDDSKVDKYFVYLTHGSLLIMDGCMQQDWQHRIPKDYHDKNARINLTFRTVYSLDNIPTEISPEYTYRQSERNAWVKSSSSKKNSLILGCYDEDFPSLGDSVATGKKMDVDRQSTDHEMDVESNISLPNNTSINSACSNIESNISEDNFESTNISCSTSEDPDNSASYSDDNPQNRNICLGLNDEKHDVNKNEQTFGNQLNDSSIPNPDEESIGLDDSFDDSSYLTEKHSYASQEHINESHRSDCDTTTASSSSSSSWKLNVNAEEFVPMSPPAPLPISEKKECDDSILDKLFAHDINNMEWEYFNSHAYCIRDEILKRIEEFGTARDELSFLCDLMEDDLPEHCQRKIINRMVHTAKMSHKKKQNNDRFKNQTHSHDQVINQTYSRENQRERSSSSRGRKFQGRQNDRRSESRSRENFKSQHTYSYERSNNAGKYPGTRDQFERGNSNRGNFNQGNYTKGYGNRRGGSYSSKSYFAQSRTQGNRSTNY